MFIKKIKKIIRATAHIILTKQQKRSIINMSYSSH